MYKQLEDSVGGSALFRSYLEVLSNHGVSNIVLDEVKKYYFGSKEWHDAVGLESADNLCMPTAMDLTPMPSMMSRSDVSLLPAIAEGNEEVKQKDIHPVISSTGSRGQVVIGMKHAHPR